ncbi:hypothetical protein ACIQMR_35060 [Streptomyces sp. NPDC091376]|uniref:hypothetical protein n=1 Tax=Streptomyces sp. NPDC091376 TaxID=3365994 RepID=UPI003800FC45
MPRVTVPVLQLTRAGVTLTQTTGDATNNHYVDNDGSTALIVENAGASSRVVTFHIVTKVDGFTVPPRTETLAAGEKQAFGPFPLAEYGGKLKIDVAHADLKLTAIRI